MALPESWQVKKFNDVLDIKNGRNQKTVEAEDGQYPILGSAGNVMGYATDYICEEGTTIIGRKGNISTPIYIATKFWNVDTAFGLSAREGLDKKYLYYYCLSYNFSALNRGTTIPSLVKTDLLGIPIPLAPLKEQKRIVAILDEAFAGISQAIANTEKNLANARELFSSYCSEIFNENRDGNKTYFLNSIFNFLGGFAFKSNDVIEKSNVQLIRMGNLYKNKLDLDRNPVFYPSDYVEKYSTYLLKERDLVISLTGTVDKEDYGYVVEIPPSELHLLLNQRIAKISFDEEKIDRNFILFFLRSRVFLDKLYSIARGTRQANLSINDIKKITISLPEHKYQHDIGKKMVDFDSYIFDLMQNYEKKLQALAELKQSLLQKAFTGELTANNVDKLVNP